ncbi:MAG TPA: hypothetical protein VG103_10900 [Chthoniobacterales bacterium]|jgi:hypothetical protein|nr:hypothetical protein [Chthoniobacterales bacterium]
MKLRNLILTFALTVSVCQAGSTGDYDAGPDIIGLPNSAKELLVAQLDAKKIIGINQMVFRRFAEFDYLGVLGGFEVPWWHGEAFIHDFVLRKKVSDPDWSKAELFYPTTPALALFCAGVPINESELKPWKKPGATTSP